MLKKLLMLILAFGLSLSAVLAVAVEVNTADETALESVKGIGPVHAKAIIDERTKNGPFKDADDLVNRVKGIGPKSVQNLEAAGLTINGSSAPPAGKTATSKSSKSAATAAAPAATTPNPMTSQAPAATTAAQAASGTAASNSKHKSKKDKTAAAASAPEAGSAAAAPATASDTKGKKPKKSKKSKAASDAAASGA